MLMSTTYRQHSRATNPAAEKIDGENRLLWRMEPRRLDAESMRDAVLMVSGALNPQMGGPGYRDFVVKQMIYDDYFLPRQAFDSTVNRRTIYRCWARSANNSLLDTLDCPDPSVTSPRRATTTTPLQALAMLNDPFMQGCAESLADRLLRMYKNSPRDQVQQAFRLALGRISDDSETTDSEQFVKRFGLARFCLMLLNTNEFLYLD